MSRNHSKNLSLDFFVPANLHYMGIRGGISDSFQILKAIVLQLRTILELKWSYNPLYWSYTGRELELQVASYQMLLLAFVVNRSLYWLEIKLR